MDQKGLLHRRHIRTKVLQCFYAYEMEEQASVSEAISKLQQSLTDVYKLYILLLKGLVELHLAGEKRKQVEEQKRFKEDNTDTLFQYFLASPTLLSLSSNAYLKSEGEKHNVYWNEDDRDMFARIFKMMAKSATFKHNETNKGVNDKAFVGQIFRDFVVNQENLQDALEEKNIFWLDDLDLVAVQILKTIEQIDFDKPERNRLVPLFKDKDDDLDFATKLLKSAINNKKAVSEMVEKLSNSWEWKRIAKMDRMMLRLGFAEAETFSQIPIKVSINEYVGLAKEYSTEDSATFVNGILDRGIKKLQSEGKLIKAGRGLVE